MQHLVLFRVNCEFKIRTVTEMLNELYPESKQNKSPFLVQQSQLDLAM